MSNDRVRGVDPKENWALAEDDVFTPSVDKCVGDEDEKAIPVRESVLQILESARQQGGYLKIAAPMVRYSKLPFREVVRRYHADVCMTPMILSDVFKQSDIARSIDFTTNGRDDPVIVQFAAANPEDLADASELVARYCSGVDLNCGCPQKWAIAEGIGCALMEKPDLVKSMVRAVKDRFTSSPWAWRLSDGSLPTCSIKIRVHSDIRQTVEMVRRAEAMGVDWVTVHGRTRRMKNTEPVILEALKTVKESATVPVFANGGVFSLEDADRTIAETGCDGVMAARGLLSNPALFAGYNVTPLEAVKAYTKSAMTYGSSFFIMHHHLMYMLEKSMSRAERKHFNALASSASVIDYLENHYGIHDFSPVSADPLNVKGEATVYTKVRRVHDMESNIQFSLKEYWEERYGRSGDSSDTYEWLKGYSFFREAIRELIPDTLSRILQLGCGNSALGPEMAADGYANQLNVDYSETCIQSMRKLYPHEDWRVADVFHLDRSLETGTFDYIIDKGTFDAVLTGFPDSDPWDPSEELLQKVQLWMAQVHKALRPGGTYIQISWAQPHFHKRLFATTFSEITVKTCGDEWPYFVYSAKSKS